LIQFADWQRLAVEKKGLTTFEIGQTSVVSVSLREVVAYREKLRVV